MKQIFTLFVLGVLCLSATKTFAQISQNFEPISGSSPLPSLTSNCWSFSGAGWDNTSQVSNTGSLVVIPTTSSSTNLTSNNAQIKTPYINWQAGYNISLKYKLSNKLATQADRTITLSLLDRNGVKTTLTSVTLTTISPFNNVLTLNYTLTVSNPGTQRLVIDVNGSGDGNTYMYLDNLSITKGSSSVQPAFHYSPSNCNTAPTALNNTYNATSNTAVYSGSSVLNNDTDPNNETLTAAVATQSLDGTVVMNTDGTFTFTPNAGFTGSFTSFTYKAADNGYDRLSSTATVYIYFPQVVTLPLHLLQFSGTAGAKTKLTWRVASNESGILFEVQRRTKETGFETIATVFTSENVGEAKYEFADAALAQATCYRLKLVNRDGTVFYSNSISFQTTGANAKITLLQNPVQNTLQFTLSQNVMAKSIQIYSLSGVAVYTQKISTTKSNNLISASLNASLPNGMYVLEVTMNTGSLTTRFLKE